MKMHIEIKISSGIIYVDLDGTLIQGNTFHYWLIHLALGRSHMSAAGRIAILKQILLRIAKKISHSELKKKVISASNKRRRLDIDNSTNHFVTSMIKKANVRVVDIINNHREKVIILATAAPEEYARIIADRYKLDDVISTSTIIDNNWNEVIKDEKKNRILVSLSERELKEFALITDHIDDLPSINISAETVLVGTIESTEKIILASSKHVKMQRILQ